MENNIETLKKFFTLIGKGYMAGVRFLGRINTAIILTVLYFTAIPIFLLISMVFKDKISGNSRWNLKKPLDPKSHEFQF